MGKSFPFTLQLINVKYFEHTLNRLKVQGGCLCKYRVKLGRPCQLLGSSLTKDYFCHVYCKNKNQGRWSLLKRSKVS